MLGRAKWQKVSIFAGLSFAQTSIATLLGQDTPKEAGILATNARQG